MAVFRAEFHKLPHAARTPMAISRVVRAAYRGVGIRFLNSVIVQLPRFIKCIMVIMMYNNFFNEACNKTLTSSIIFNCFNSIINLFILHLKNLTYYNTKKRAYALFLEKFSNIIYSYKIIRPKTRISPAICKAYFIFSWNFSTNNFFN